MFNRNNRSTEADQPFRLNTAKSNNNDKGNEAAESLDTILAVASTNNSKRKSTRIRQNEAAKGVAIEVPSITDSSLPKRRGRARFDHNTNYNGKRRAAGALEEDDDFQDQHPKMAKNKFNSRVLKKGKTSKAKNNKEEKEDTKVPELVIRSSKRKVNGAPSTLEDKKKREEDQRKKQEEIENLSFSSNLDVDDFLNDTDNGKIFSKKLGGLSIVLMYHDFLGKVVCPFCHNDLGKRKELPEKVRLALKIIKKKDKQFEQEETERIKERASTQHQKFLEKRLHIQRKASNMEQYSFCRLHRVELNVKPEGAQQGYPLNIEFDKLEGRIIKLKKDLEAVISGKVSSQFRDMALKSYEEDGVNKARSTMAVMSRFDKTLPGYYGSKGAAIILEVLSSLFLHSGELTIKQTQPQLPLEYVQQVLVPEAGLRLIQQDLKKTPKMKREQYTMEMAMKRMEESREFGCLVYPANNEDAGEFDDENFIDLTSSSEDDIYSSDSDLE
ncbi:hypothetical protein INT45_007785 [Circinella minor]|uniref:Restriction of telomere capping protein 4 n=1 Tax=Circinella minor TaxID=1195481 RepID=A0A8H7RYZ6_9FUNG|nr:hypothetical protein INT45_007785 [Circinella minor]